MVKLESRAVLVLLSLVGACGRASHAPAPPPSPAAIAPQLARADSTPDSVSVTVSIAGIDTSHADTVRVADIEIARRALDLFGDTALPPAIPDSLEDPEDEEPTWDIDVHSYLTHDRVEHFLNQYTGNARHRIAERLSRGSRYEPMIRSKLLAGGIPEDMYYLALVESGFDPHAYSRAAAVGMWQFMTTTARGVGLRVDWWVDERRDPVRSTDAAVKYLRSLRQQFGSLYLAAAAYNGGSGRVSRGLNRFAGQLGGTSGDDRYFALAEKDYLPRDTKNYVPQLIAAALVGKDPERYGLQVRREPPFTYDSVTVPASTPLSAIARASGAELAEIVELNSRVLRGVTPPDGPFLVRVPSERATGFDSAFAALPLEERAAFNRVVSKKGESAATIASRHGITARQLAWYNPGLARLKSGRLRPGQTVLVPARAVVAAALDVPDPKLEIYGRAAASNARVHIVRRGESLGAIARKYRTSVASIVRLNGLRKHVIYPGQRLAVRGKAVRVARTSAKARPTRASSKAGAGGR